MSTLFGIIVILIASATPSLFPVGILWPLSIAAVLSFICGVSGKFSTLKFSVGVVVGFCVWVLINFSSWAQLSVILAALQIAPTFVAILVFAIGFFFSPVHTHNKARNPTATPPVR